MINKNKQDFIILLSKVERQGIEELLKYLELDTDFYHAPASTRYHGSYEGGLCEHSLNVYFELKALVDFYQLDLPQESLIIASLLHDLCKVNLYKETIVNVPPNKTESGKWEQQQGFIKKDELPMGHGAKSLSIVQDFIKLTDLEKQAIYWHMGFCDLGAYSTINDLSAAFENNQLAFIVHMADMAATYIAENNKVKFLQP